MTAAAVARDRERQPKAATPSTEAVDHAASMLLYGSPTALLLAGNALYGEGLKAAGRIATATGAKLLAPYPISRVQRGAGNPVVQRIPYVPDQAVELLNTFLSGNPPGRCCSNFLFCLPGQ